MRLVASAGPGGSTSFALVDHDDLAGLSLAAPAALALTDPFRAQPRGAGSREEVTVAAAHIIDRARRDGYGDDWVTRFREVLDRVAPYGWWDPDTDEVRLHVERR